jgi:bacterioferritin-associated ferredoxin
MIVCSCNALSDNAVRACLAPGPDCPYTPAQVYRCLGCSPQCGRCARTIRQIMEAALPAVHGACTSQCSRACPLSAAVAEIEIYDTVDIAEPGSAVEIRESLEIHAYAD